MAEEPSAEEGLAEEAHCLQIFRSKFSYWSKWFSEQYFLIKTVTIIVIYELMYLDYYNVFVSLITRYFIIRLNLAVYYSAPETM